MLLKYIDDIHNQLDRAVKQRFQASYSYEDSYANEESVLTLMGSVAMEPKAYDRILPNITFDKQLFPD